MSDDSIDAILRRMSRESFRMIGEINDLRGRFPSDIDKRKLTAMFDAAHIVEFNAERLRESARQRKI